VRWNHPEYGLLGPDHFVDVAETSGLISALGSQVLRKACAATRTWHELGCPFHISVNAAAAQLNSRDFVAEIEAALKEFQLEPGQVTIELTETAAMQVADSLENLQRIRRLGVHLSLDDFGTGYSSLSFLRELPVDAIKIDRSFVTGLGTNPRDASIVQGVIAMAAALGHDVVAEGIETAAQAETLRQIGCRYAQGFLWSRPVPAADIPEIARRIERHDSTV
jgi:EAL domain-containing protein (putative c-di-GMP-specific phosphodiesterase class I)